MRWLVGLLLAALAPLAPVASADPSVSVPDPDPLVAATEGTVNSTVADAIATHHSNMWDVSQVIAEAQKLRFANSSLEHALVSTGAFATRTVERSGELRSAGTQWVLAEEGRKAQEAGAFGAALDETVATTIASLTAVAGALLEEACRSGPLVDPGSPGAPQCTPDSLAGETLAALQTIVNDLLGALEDMGFTQSLAAARAFLALFVPPPV